MDVQINPAKQNILGRYTTRTCAGLDSIDPIIYSRLLPQHSATPKTTMKIIMKS